MFTLYSKSILIGKTNTCPTNGIIVLLCVVFYLFFKSELQCAVMKRKIWEIEGECAIGVNRRGMCYRGK